MASLSEKISILSNPAPTVLDPEDDVNTETVAKIEKHIDNSEALFTTSELRSKAAALSGDSDPAYIGKKVSRKSLDGIFNDDSKDDLDSGDKTDSNLEDDDNDDDEDDDDDDDDDDDNDDDIDEESEDYGDLEEFKQKFTKQMENEESIEEDESADESVDSEISDEAEINIVEYDVYSNMNDDCHPGDIENAITMELLLNEISSTPIRTSMELQKSPDSHQKASGNNVLQIPQRRKRINHSSLVADALIEQAKRRKVLIEKEHEMNMELKQECEMRKKKHEMRKKEHEMRKKEHELKMEILREQFNLLKKKMLDEGPSRFIDSD